jgi:uncharacterized protein (DUF983 family)
MTPDFSKLIEALRQWKCPACGGTQVYSGYSAAAPNGGPCRKCAETEGLHPVAFAALKEVEAVK